MEKIVVANLDNAIEAALIKECLEDNQIPHYIEFAQDNSLTVFIGKGAESFMPFARVWANTDDAERIVSLIAEIRKAPLIKAEEN